MLRNSFKINNRCYYKKYIGNTVKQQYISQKKCINLLQKLQYHKFDNLFSRVSIQENIKTNTEIKNPRLQKQILIGARKMTKQATTDKFDIVHKPNADYDLVNFNLTANDINIKLEKILKEGKDVLDKVASIKPSNGNNGVGEEAGFDNVIGYISRHDNETAAEISSISFLQYVSSDPEIRKASVAAEKKLREFDIDSKMRDDVYSVVKRVIDSKEKWEGLCEEDKRLVNKTELMYKRVGMQLEKSERDKLKEIKKRLSELSIDFQENIIKDDGVIWFSKNELEGLPDDFFEGRTQKEDKEDGQVKYEVTTKYPDLFPVLRMAKNGETRRRLQVFEAQRCKENVKILEEAVELRFEAAKILGYKSHADFVLENKMAKTVANVEKFEKELRELLEPIAAKELEDMLELKRKDEGAKGANVDDCIYVWDFRYYLRLLKEKLYNVDEEKIKEYFAMENVVSGILSIYQEMLGLKFIQVDNSSGWHKDAQLFEVYNSEDKSFVGHFWMDMHPREGKYTHAACWSLRPGFERADGSRQYPVSAIVANLSKPTPTRPSLLKHDELVTFFHEFGHLMHNICSQTKWSRFHGVEVERDFVEAPSQMLENWCWEPEVLQTFAKHYETNEPIPAEVVTKLVNAKNLGAGLLNLRQIFFGLFDLQLHSLTSSPKVNPIDIVKLYNDLRFQISNVHSGEEETWQVATFGHIMGGYDSGYYGYLWSEVFSADMFYSRFKVEGLKNKKTGYDYKNLVLGPGGSKDGMDILIDFLGREPNNVSFLKSIGIY